MIPTDFWEDKMDLYPILHKEVRFLYRIPVKVPLRVFS